jgi:hypothetical protein
MPTMMHIRATLTPWDDLAFNRTYEAARREASETEGGDGLHMAILVERLLREYGYPGATVTVERTVEEALAQTEHWVVRRDG